MCIKDSGVYICNFLNILNLTVFLSHFQKLWNQKIPSLESVWWKAHLHQFMNKIQNTKYKIPPRNRGIFCIAFRESLYIVILAYSFILNYVHHILYTLIHYSYPSFLYYDSRDVFLDYYKNTKNIQYDKRILRKYTNSRSKSVIV